MVPDPDDNAASSSRSSMYSWSVSGHQPPCTTPAEPCAGFNCNRGCAIVHRRAWEMSKDNGGADMSGLFRTRECMGYLRIGVGLGLAGFVPVVADQVVEVVLPSCEADAVTKCPGDGGQGRCDSGRAYPDDQRAHGCFRGGAAGRGW